MWDEKSGEKLRLYRKLKGLSQAKLAEEIDVNQGTIARWERGEQGPQGNNLNLLTKFFDITPADFYDASQQEKEDDMNKSNMFCIKTAGTEIYMPNTEETRKIFEKFLTDFSSSLEKLGMKIVHGDNGNYSNSKSTIIGGNNYGVN